MQRLNSGHTHNTNQSQPLPEAYFYEMNKKRRLLELYQNREGRNPQEDMRFVPHIGQQSLQSEYERNLLLLHHLTGNVTQNGFVNNTNALQENQMSRSQHICGLNLINGVRNYVPSVGSNAELSDFTLRLKLIDEQINAILKRRSSTSFAQSHHAYSSMNQTQPELGQQDHIARSGVFNLIGLQMNGTNSTCDLSLHPHNIIPSMSRLV